MIYGSFILSHCAAYGHISGGAVDLRHLCHGRICDSSRVRSYDTAVDGSRTA